ncbi:MAG: hypothetical protein KGH64_00770 [Candidatus Micrarchaeota archaeon]|nr:hypothetical protein [Candidatus Micrarchaeota archaeon]
MGKMYSFEAWFKNSTYRRFLCRSNRDAHQMRTRLKSNTVLVSEIRKVDKPLPPIVTLGHFPNVEELAKRYPNASQKR